MIRARDAAAADLAQMVAVGVVGLTPTSFRALTIRERNAIIREVNRRGR